MNKKFLIFTGIALATIVLMYFIISPTTYYNWITFYTIITGLIIGLCVFLALKPTEDERYEPETFQKAKTKMTLASVFAPIACIITIAFGIWHLINTKNTYLKKHAIIGKGEILDGQSNTKKSGKYGTSTVTDYTVQVKFFPPNSKQFILKTIDVDATVFNNAGKGQKVFVAYIKEDPEYLKILNTEEAIKEFESKIDSKTPTLTDFLAIAQNKDSAKNILKKVSDFWDMETKNKKEEYYESTFMNFYSKDEIALKSNGEFTFLNMSSPKTFDEVLANARVELKLIYDSLATNDIKGAKFTNGEFDFYFERFNMADKKETIFKDGKITPSKKSAYNNTKAILICKANERALLPSQLNALNNAFGNPNSDGKNENLDRMLELIKKD